MTKGELSDFIARHRYVVQASTGAAGPQAAVIGVAPLPGFGLVFDTLESTRKCQNLRRDPRIALVIGWDDAQTVQYEGLADEPRGTELSAIKAAYFTQFSDGRSRESWPGITYFRVRPQWIRYSDFRGTEPRVLEWRAEDLSA
jgi:uncharacterized protein YhbP (UPF0306 family)